MQASNTPRTRIADPAIALLSRGCVLLARAIFRAKTAHALERTGVRNVLVVQPYDTVGDVIFTSPLIRELKRAFPDAEIVVATSAHGVPGILDENPHITEQIPVNVRCSKWLRPVLLPWRHWRMARKTLRQKEFDVAIVPRYSVDAYYATFLAYFSGAPRRIGYTEKADERKRVLNCGYDLLLTDVLPASLPFKNDVLRCLHVITPLIHKEPADNRTELWVSDADRQFASAALPEPGSRRICIGPTSGHSLMRQWGAERYAELAVALRRQGCEIVLVGTAQDKQVTGQIESALQGECLNFVQRTNLRQAAAVMAECAVFIGNDAGLGHIAGAMGVPVVSIFGSSCHHQFAPWGERNRVVTIDMECGPCSTVHRDRCFRCIHSSLRCMEAISVAEVLGVVLSLLPPALH